MSPTESWGSKMMCLTPKNCLCSSKCEIIYINCGFFQNNLRDFLNIQISKTDHFEWSKAIIKLKPFWEAPDKKLGVQNDGHGPTNFFTRPKVRKSVLKVMDFCKICWEIFDFLSKTQNGPFSRPIYYQIHLNID